MRRGKRIGEKLGLFGKSLWMHEAAPRRMRERRLPEPEWPTSNTTVLYFTQRLPIQAFPVRLGR